ncbi:hypothetical protein QC764_113950 [Podospora pseudoanserina]|uniref:Transmembrane protein 32 n=1 Tax=Podospora pseudoanserina TaxID=2609844 RepID=A0ABR0IPK9_9PEZI|nr:hypothetical protein QC764_113950 [Podospora pseudoanserina]
MHILWRPACPVPICETSLACSSQKTKRGQVESKTGSRQLEFLEDGWVWMKEPSTWDRVLETMRIGGESFRLSAYTQLDRCGYATIGIWPLLPWHFWECSQPVGIVVTRSISKSTAKGINPNSSTMTLISKSITAFGSLLLAHACYSAQEHSALQSFRAATSAALTSTPTAATSLPIDIAIETAVAILVILVGLVLGTSPLRPIQWREWAGKIEREGGDGFKDNNGQVNRDYLGNPFAYIEGRPNFVDIRKQRNEFTEWVKGQGQEQK